MKARPVLLFLFCLMLLISCKKDNITPENICETVALIDADTGAWFDKTIMLYEDSDYLIKAPVGLFISDLYRFPVIDYEDYLYTIDKIANDAKEQDTLHVEDYFLSQRKISVVAHMLEKGDCYVYSKKKQGAPLKELCLTRFGCAAPLAGAFGRKFYFEGLLFLEIVDGNC